MSKSPNERTRHVIEWLNVAQEIANEDNATLPQLLSEADTETLMYVYDSCLEVLGDQVVLNDGSDEILAALRKELAARLLTN
jgi:hypothetical protein